MDIEQLYSGILEGKNKFLARSITLIESILPKHQELASELLTKIMPHTGNSIRLGITGVPGVGKSTFIEALGSHLVGLGYKVAVLAIDPSSSVSGGSILADKTRMEKLAVLDNAFIRPSPSGNYLGGVAQKTRETMMLCEAAGYDVIIVETVGVGQSETELANMVDFFLFLALANAGDELQGIKKGILELADSIAVNKADKKFMEQARLAKQIYENTLHIVNPPSDIWAPKVHLCSALEQTGISDIWDTIISHNKKTKDSGFLEEKRRKQSISWMWAIVEDGIKHYFTELPSVKEAIKDFEGKILNNTISSTYAAQEILNKIKNN